MPTLPGPLELILILVIVAMLFGVGKLPEVFGSVGKGIREFREASSTDDDDDDKAMDSNNATVEKAASSAESS